VRGARGTTGTCRSGRMPVHWRARAARDGRRTVGGGDLGRGKAMFRLFARRVTHAAQTMTKKGRNDRHFNAAHVTLLVAALLCVV
jgi:hypothetical protein